MNINLQISVPDNLSNEAIYHIIEFLAELSRELDNHYIALLRRYINSFSKEPPSCVNDIIEDPPF